MSLTIDVPYTDAEGNHHNKERWLDTEVAELLGYSRRTLANRLKMIRSLRTDFPVPRHARSYHIGAIAYLQVVEQWATANLPEGQTKPDLLEVEINLKTTSTQKMEELVYDQIQQFKEQSC